MTSQPIFIPDWSPKAPSWSLEELHLFPSQVTTANDETLDLIIEKSDSFTRSFPIDTNRCKTLKNFTNPQVLERNINSAYPLIHENILHLYAKFLLHKHLYGNSIEKNFYKNMNLMELVDRLLRKRAVTFMGKRDLYTLLDGKKGSQNWESIGTENEKAPLCLENCLSYDEIKLSAFLSVSSFTYFVNLGDRKNFGVFCNERDVIQDEGVIVGIIGPRLVKEEVMEYQELVISKKQNCKAKGYGDVKPPTIHHLFSKLYDEECLEYDGIMEKKNQLEKHIMRFTDLKRGEILDNFVYSKRLVFSIDTLFIEANHRALNQQTTAFVHVVGIGLGVWKKSPCQNKIFMDTCGQRLTTLGKHLIGISDVCFVWINHDSCLTYKNGDMIPIDEHPLGGIKIHMNKREPHRRLTGPEDSSKLLVVSYAWDGNALPGNEFWNKKLGSSGDSAAASSTQITEIHNPFINSKVCALNLKIISQGEIIELKKYIASVKTRKRKSLD